MSQCLAPRRAVLISALLLAMAGQVAHAGDTGDCVADTPNGEHVAGCDRHVAQLSAMTVAATLNPRPVAQVAADVSVITRQDMDRHLVDSLRDLIRYEPGVSVTSSPGRYGQSGFSIRGLGGNRVRIEVDGVPVSDSFSFGSMLSAGRNMVDLDSVKRVEIVRGPASSLYGSDALGGVVAYVTKDPADYLVNGKGVHVSAKGQYDTANRGNALSATLAVGDGGQGFMLIGTHREAAQTTNKGTVDTLGATRTRPDPQDLRADNVLAKYVHRADSGRVDRLTLGAQRNHARTHLLSARDVDTAAFIGRDRVERERLSFGQTWTALDATLADKVHWKAWAQRSDTEQHSVEQRRVGPGYERHVSESFTQRVFGAQLHAFKQIVTGHVSHDITWGVDVAQTHTKELRDGQAINLATGAVSKTTAGGNADNYPIRDFPPSTTTNVGVFVQDEIHLADGAVHLIPGLRLDYYRFDPQADALFDSQPLAEHVAGQSDHHVSPKLGVVWQFAKHYNMYAQYASGFRAPPYSDLGMLFSNLRYGYAAIPNPDLKPETSQSLELGLRGQGDVGHFTIAVYANRYRDFIASEHMIARGQWPDWAAKTPGLSIVFQSVNLTRARIRGAEAGGELYLGALNDALAGWHIRGSVSASRGDSRTGAGERVPFDSIAPMRAVLGVGYSGYHWGVELDATGVARKHRLARASAFRAPGYATFDLYAHWLPTESLKLYAGITNLSDHRYWTWGNLHGGAIGSSVDTSAVIDRYSAPGRALSVAMRYTF